MFKCIFQTSATLSSRFWNWRSRSQDYRLGVNSCLILDLNSIFCTFFLKNFHSQLSNITCISFLTLRSHFLTFLRNRNQWEIHPIKSTRYTNMAVLFALKARTEKRYAKIFALLHFRLRYRLSFSILTDNLSLLTLIFIFNSQEIIWETSFSFSKFTLSKIFPCVLRLLFDSQWAFSRRSLVFSPSFSDH